MALSLAVITGLALLLPGLFAMMVWNARGRRHGGSRPDLPITAVSVLAFGIAISLVTHIGAWIIFDALIQMTKAIGERFGSFGPAVANPIETMVAFSRGGTPAGAITPPQIAIAAGTLIGECLLLASILMDDGLDLMLDGVDFGNQGWVYANVLRPAQNGYRPIAYVLTTLMKDGLGVGYRGTIADIRQSDRGETLAITLGEAARFLFELKPGIKEISYGAEPREPAFQRYAEDDIGAVVALDARVIQNIVVANRRSSQLDLLSQLRRDLAEEEAAKKSPSAATNS